MLFCIEKEKRVYTFKSIILIIVLRRVDKFTVVDTRRYFYTFKLRNKIS